MGVFKQLQIKFQDQLTQLVATINRAKDDGKLVDDYAELELNPDYCHNVAAYLLGAFNWGATVEGTDFWRYVFQRLKELEND